MKLPRSICILVDDYLPASTKVAAKMMHELALEFKARGIPTTVITPSATAKSSSAPQFLDNIVVYRFKSGQIKNTSKIGRAVNEMLLPFRALWNMRDYIKHNQHDMIVFFNPTIFWGPLVLNLKKRWNCFAYEVLRDFFPQWAIDQGLLKQKSLITAIFRWFEHKSHAAADMIGIQPAGNIDVFNRLHPDQFPTELLYNWTSEKKISRIKSGPARMKLGLKEKVVFFYGGNIGTAQGMDNLIELVHRFRSDHKAHFLFVGSGDSVPRLLAMQKELGLVNMSYLPPLDQENFALLQAEFDIGLFCLDSSHTTHNIPGKILGYLGTGMPVLGCVNKGNDLHHIINQSGAGRVTWSNDPDQLENEARKMLNVRVRSKMSRNALRLRAELFSVKSAVNTILGAYQVRWSKDEETRSL